jgi:ParB-like chromosome segregation protein Spo0J
MSEQGDMHRSVKRARLAVDGKVMGVTMASLDEDRLRRFAAEIGEDIAKLDAENLVATLMERVGAQWRKDPNAYLQCDCGFISHHSITCPCCGEPDEEEASENKPLDSIMPLLFGESEIVMLDPEDVPTHPADLPLHPACAAFPEMTTEYADLVTHMKRYGYDRSQPIILCGGLVLDGRHRAKGSREAGVEPVCAKLRSDIDPWAYAWRKNGLRRSLKPAERAALYLELKKASGEWRPEKDANETRSEKTSERRKSAKEQANGEVGPSGHVADARGRQRDLFAAEAGVGARTMGRAMAKGRKAAAPAKSTNKRVEDAALAKLNKRLRDAAVAARTVATQLAGIELDAVYWTRAGGELRPGVKLSRTLEGAHDELSRILHMECRVSKPVKISKVRESFRKAGK